ncbi:hypothetical protein, partial [Burkholderia sp. SIMBA_024]|uniref:hypothetical protein n=1 Tax=Burkholderia sp. SIMBA_024 TaxID=3085768 RepID=UPI003979811A
VTLSFQAQQRDIVNLRRVLAWAEKNRCNVQTRIEERQHEVQQAGREDLQSDIKARIRLLRATKDLDYYDGIRRTVKTLLGKWKSDHPELFPDEDEPDGEAERRAGGEGEDGGPQGPVSERREVPP